VQSVIPTSRSTPPESPVIAVVDDDPSVVEAVVSLMESVGYSAGGFSSAEQFLASRRGATACLILDVRMPGIGGLELQRRLAAKGDRTPIVFITAHESEASTEASRLGAVAFLLKPFSQESLLDAVRSALASGHQSPDQIPR
jgi:FixJ family two-component response regulator